MVVTWIKDIFVYIGLCYYGLTKIGKIYIHVAHGGALNIRNSL